MRLLFTFVLCSVARGQQIDLEKRPHKRYLKKLSRQKVSKPPAIHPYSQTLSSDPPSPLTLLDSYPSSPPASWSIDSSVSNRPSNNPYVIPSLNSSRTHTLSQRSSPSSSTSIASMPTIPLAFPADLRNSPFLSSNPDPSKTPTSFEQTSHISSFSTSLVPSTLPSIFPSSDESSTLTFWPAPSINPSSIPTSITKLSPHSGPRSVSQMLTKSPFANFSLTSISPPHSTSLNTTIAPLVLSGNNSSATPSQLLSEPRSLHPSKDPTSNLPILSQRPSSIPSNVAPSIRSTSLSRSRSSALSRSVTLTQRPNSARLLVPSSLPSVSPSSFSISIPTYTTPYLMPHLKYPTFAHPSLSLSPTSLAFRSMLSPEMGSIVSHGCATSVRAKRMTYNGSCIVSSPSRKLTFGLALDGDLGIWNDDNKIWSAGTRGATAAILQLDGNLVIRTRNEVLWTSHTTGEIAGLSMIEINDMGVVTVRNHEAQKELTIIPSINVYSSCPSELRGIIQLDHGDHICSRNGEYTFGLSVDGVLGIWRRGEQIWSPCTCCDGRRVRAKLQIDGEFVLENAESKKRLWSSQTFGSEFSDARIALSDEGILTFFNKGSGKVMTVNPSNLQNQEALRTIPLYASSHACIAVGKLTGYTVLTMGNFLCSVNKRFSLGVNSSGNFGLFDGDDEIWSASTCCGEDRVAAYFQLDGNLVIKNSRKEILWASRTHNSNRIGDHSITLSNSGVVTLLNPPRQKLWAVAPSPPNFYCRKQTNGRLILKMTEFICSENGLYRFGMFDGDLSLWEANRLRWSAGICCSNSTLVMKVRYSGNLVVVNQRQKSIWSASTGQNAGASLRLDNTGRLYVVSSSGDILWSPKPADLLDISEFSLPKNYPSPPPLKSLEPTSQTPLSTLETAGPSLAPTFGVQTFSHGHPSSAIPSLASDENLRLSHIVSLSPSASAIKTPIYLRPKGNLQCEEYKAGFLVLEPGKSVCSPNGRFKFGMSLDGDLVLLDGISTVFKANTMGNRAILQHDCNLVVYSSDGKPSWSTRTHVNSVDDGFALVVGDDGVAVVKCSVHGYVWSTAVTSKNRVKAESLTNKVMTGYQGWFHAKGDGGWDRWNHWSDHNTIPTKDTVLVDMWPDTSDLSPDELFPTGFTFPNGTVASLYSASNTKTVERHCKWMQNYDIDGLFLQRFIGSATRFPDVLNQVMKNVRSGAEKYGRVFSIMYDISNGNDSTLVKDIIDDWKHLVDQYHVTKSRQYLHHRGRPLLGIWGFGVWDREADYYHAQEILDWFQYEAEPKYQVSFMGGLPAGWRNLSRDSKINLAWQNIYRRFEIISPWTVGRYGNEQTADAFLEKYIIPDMLECASLGIDYLPVVFPGFSAHHVMNKPLNSIPRYGGNFLWRQLYNVLLAGNTMLYIAMFDEVDEGTAIFKIAPTQAQMPREAPFVSLDADGFQLPSDWYLRLVREVSSYVHDGVECPKEIPFSP